MRYSFCALKMCSVLTLYRNHFSPKFVAIPAQHTHFERGYLKNVQCTFVISKSLLSEVCCYSKLSTHISDGVISDTFSVPAILVWVAFAGSDFSACSHIPIF